MYAVFAYVQGRKVVEQRRSSCRGAKNGHAPTYDIRVGNIALASCLSSHRARAHNLFQAQLSDTKQKPAAAGFIAPI